MSGVQVNELRYSLRGKIESLAESLLGPRSRAQSDGRDCHWGANGKVRIWVARSKRGGWADFFSGTDHGDPIAVIRHALGKSFDKAVAWARWPDAITWYPPSRSVIALAIGTTADGTVELVQYIALNANDEKRRDEDKDELRRRNLPATKATNGHETRAVVVRLPDREPVVVAEGKVTITDQACPAAKQRAKTAEIARELPAGGLT